MCKQASRGPDGATRTPAWGFIVLQHPDDMKSRKNRRKVRHHLRNDIRQSKRVPGAMIGTVVMPAQAAIRCGGTAKCLSLHPRADASLRFPAERRAHEIKAFLVRRHSPFCMKVRELCFSLALFDEGSYNFALAEMALHEGPSATRDFPYSETHMALQHYNKALSHVQKRMCSSDPYQSSSHELLGLVLGLASYDLSSGNMERWKLHMAGLHLLMHRRGGLQAYPSVYFQLSLLWTEATGSLLLDLAPRFDIPLGIMQPYRKPVINPLLKRNLFSLRSMAPHLDQIASMMELMTGVSSSFVRQADNVNEERDDGDYAVYCITRARTSYLLLRVERLDLDMTLDKTTSEAMIIGEIIRLSALLFLLRLAGFTPVTVHHHTDRLLQLLGCDKGHWTGCEELQLWVLIITAVMMDGSSGPQEALPDRIRDLLGHLGLGWDDVFDILSKFPWVQSLFKPELARLGNVMRSD